MRTPLHSRFKFVPFHRVGGKGTGLGLALVRRIVKISGGRLGVRSKEGQGSTFWVELPVGIGKKTFVTDLPVAGSGESSAASSGKGVLTQHPSKQRLRPQDTGCDILTVADEPGTRGLGLKKVPPPDAQTFAAMQGIMEQGALLLSVYCPSTYLPCFGRRTSGPGIETTVHVTTSRGGVVECKSGSTNTASSTYDASRGSIGATV